MQPGSTPRGKAQRVVLLVHDQLVQDPELSSQRAQGTYGAQQGCGGASWLWLWETQSHITDELVKSRSRVHKADLR